jgi:DNA-binding beta-propeller fold protein YncE
VAHTANDAIDVIDLVARKYVGSIRGLTAPAGALVTEAPDVVFTSNRGEDTVGIFTPANEMVEKIGVGVKPNGLAYDPGRRRLLSAHVGDPAVAGSCTVSMIDVAARRRIADLPVAGRTRWTVYDPVVGAFHVNIADPPQIVVVGSGDPVAIRRVVAIPHAGPHGLDIDVERRRLFCACDAGVLLEVDNIRRLHEPARGIAWMDSCSAVISVGRSRCFVADRPSDIYRIAWKGTAGVVPHTASMAYESSD